MSPHGATVRTMSQVTEVRTTECRCGETVELATWWSNACPRCGTEYNGAGQRLRAGWRDNASLHDSDVSDLDGYEQSHAGD